MSNNTVVVHNFETMVTSLREASRLFEDDTIDNATRWSCIVSQLDTANHRVYLVNRDGGKTSELLETLVANSFRQATKELAEIREGRNAKFFVVRPLVNISLCIATEELIAARSTKTQTDTEAENTPEDKAGAETPSGQDGQEDSIDPETLWKMLNFLAVFRHFTNK